jgi:hypothetical protein
MNTVATKIAVGFVIPRSKIRKESIAIRIISTPMNVRTSTPKTLRNTRRRATRMSPRPNPQNFSVKNTTYPNGNVVFVIPNFSVASTKEMP